MKPEERELRERLDTCIQEKKDLERIQKKRIIELGEKIRLLEARNLSLKRYSSGLHEERDELQEERDELRERITALEEHQKKS